jgi:hypothetical protein
VTVRLLDGLVDRAVQPEIIGGDDQQLLQARILRPYDR